MHLCKCVIMDENHILELERHQIEQILELDSEELEVEEVESVQGSDDGHDIGSGHAYQGELAFDTGLASLHTYLGDVDDTHHRISFLDGGAVLNLPLFYLEGAVLFPEAILPLRVIQHAFIGTIERAMNQVDAPFTMGVVHVHRDTHNGRLKFAAVGTTAEIRQHRHLEDGSVNVVTRGQQRFHVRRRWFDVDGTPCGEIQIIQEDVPLRTPQDAFGFLPPLRSRGCRHLCRSKPSITCAKGEGDSAEINDSEEDSEESFESELSLTEMKLHQSAVNSCTGYDIVDESTSSDDEKNVFASDLPSRKLLATSSNGSSLLAHERTASDGSRAGRKETEKESSYLDKGWRKGRLISKVQRSRGVPRAFWPYWVYQMYDSFCLAQKAADMWKQIVGSPSMDGIARKPDMLSFYIASKMPISESTRQELLEIDGTSYRLRREIEVLERFDRVRCKNCQTVIAKRSDMMVMSSEGPLGAYVNPHGFVHEIMTFKRATGLALIGRAVKEFSWFPGYAWTIVNCSTCESQMGWLFTATNRKLEPRSFWAVRSSQVADDMR